MKKNFYKIGVVFASALLLGACSANNETKDSAKENKTEQTSKKQEKKVNVKEEVEKDAEVLLNAVLTRSNTGFSKIYGTTYDKWSDPMISVGVQEYIEENNYKPESKYTMEYLKGYGQDTPSDVVRNFYETRRDMMKDIKDFEITNIKVDEDKETAEVTYSSRSINSIAASNNVTNLMLTLFKGNVDSLNKLNQASNADEEIAKLKGLVNLFLFSNVFSGNFLGYEDVATEFAYTPLTTNEYEKTISLEKDKNDNWVISDEDYRSMISDLMNQDEKASEVYYQEENI